MRIIIGYNDSTQRLIFSDSWGAGNEVEDCYLCPISNNL